MVLLGPDVSSDVLQPVSGDTGTGFIVYEISDAYAYMQPTLQGFVYHIIYLYYIVL